MKVSITEVRARKYSVRHRFYLVVRARGRLGLPDRRDLRAITKRKDKVLSARQAHNVNLGDEI
jgi:hypothetical protein